MYRSYIVTPIMNDSVPLRCRLVKKEAMLRLNLFYYVDRQHRKYRLFAGLWFGNRKPHFQTLMQPFAIALKDLFHKGKCVVVHCTNLFKFRPMQAV